MIKRMLYEADIYLFAYIIILYLQYIIAVCAHLDCDWLICGVGVSGRDWWDRTLAGFHALTPPEYLPMTMKCQIYVACH